MNGKLVLITGGNRGLGLEACKKVLQRGGRVLLTARNVDTGAKIANELEKASGTPGACAFLPLDTSSSKSIDAFVASVQENYDQKINVLVNNAAIYPQAWTASDYEAAIKTNYQGPVELTRKLAPHLARGGTVVMVSSGYGQRVHLTPDYQSLIHDAPDLEALGQVQFKPESPMANTDVPTYKVTKNMMNRAVQLLAQDPLLREHNLSIAAVTPGWCRTEMGGSSATRSASQGADSILWVAERGGDEINGGFYYDGHPKDW